MPVEFHTSKLEFSPDECLKRKLGTFKQTLLGAESCLALTNTEQKSVTEIKNNVKADLLKFVPITVTWTH